MELNDFDTRLVFAAHEGVGQAFGREGLAGAWCSLKDDILFASQQSGQSIVTFLRQIHLVEELLASVRVGSQRLRCVDGFLRRV